MAQLKNNYSRKFVDLGSPSILNSEVIPTRMMNRKHSNRRHKIERARATRTRTSGCPDHLCGCRRAERRADAVEREKQNAFLLLNKRGYLKTDPNSCKVLTITITYSYNLLV